MSKRLGKIGFIAGCFDGPNGFHDGHKYLLEEANKYCSEIMVAINEDEYIINTKGRSPLTNIALRKLRLSVSGLVDEVFIFYANPIDLILKYKPDYIFVGSDYKMRDVVGYEESKEWGGEVILIDRLPNISTTEIIAKTKEYEI